MPDSNSVPQPVSKLKLLLRFGLAGLSFTATSLAVIAAFVYLTGMVSGMTTLAIVYVLLVPALCVSIMSGALVAYLTIRRMSTSNSWILFICAITLTVESLVYLIGIRAYFAGSSIPLLVTLGTFIVSCISVAAFVGIGIQQIYRLPKVATNLVAILLVTGGGILCVATVGRAPNAASADGASQAGYVIYLPPVHSSHKAVHIQPTYDDYRQGTTVSILDHNNSRPMYQSPYPGSLPTPDCGKEYATAQDFYSYICTLVAQQQTMKVYKQIDTPLSGDPTGIVTRYFAVTPTTVIQFWLEDYDKYEPEGGRVPDESATIAFMKSLQPGTREQFVQLLEND